MVIRHFPPLPVRPFLLISSLVVSLFLVILSFLSYRIFFSGKNLPANQDLPTSEVVDLTGGLTQSKEPKVTEVSNLFTYDPQKRQGVGPLSNYNLDEPSFSLKLPNGWILRKPDSSVNRLSTVSPSVNLGIQGGRATIGVNIIRPLAGTLVEAVKAEKEEISKVGMARYFFADKETKLNGRAAYLLEYKIKSEGAGEAEQQWNHHVDIFFIKNGYLIDLYASTREKDWVQFVETIQKSINTFELLTG